MYLIMLSPYILIIGLIMLSVYNRRKFNRSAYSKASGNTYKEVRRNKGNYGEYDSFLRLERLGLYKRLLVNVYMPTGTGKTTEIDLIMICTKGIYVFESKNYSGWIYGNERYTDWNQTFKTGKKNKFYNPVWQNKGHISALKVALGLDDKYFKSFILFSERCTIKELDISSDVTVGKRHSVLSSLISSIETAPDVLTVSECEEVYYALKKFTNVPENVKLRHIEEINAGRRVNY